MLIVRCVRKRESYRFTAINTNIKSHTSDCADNYGRSSQTPFTLKNIALFQNRNSITSTINHIESLDSLVTFKYSWDRRYRGYGIDTSRSYSTNTKGPVSAKQNEFLKSRIVENTKNISKNRNDAADPSNRNKNLGSKARSQSYVSDHNAGTRSTNLRKENIKYENDYEGVINSKYLRIESAPSVRQGDYICVAVSIPANFTSVNAANAITQLNSLPKDFKSLSFSSLSTFKSFLRLFWVMRDKVSSRIKNPALCQAITSSIAAAISEFGSKLRENGTVNVSNDDGAAVQIQHHGEFLGNILWALPFLDVNETLYTILAHEVEYLASKSEDFKRVLSGFDLVLAIHGLSIVSGSTKSQRALIKASTSLVNMITPQDLYEEHHIGLICESIRGLSGSSSEEEAFINAIANKIKESRSDDNWIDSPTKSAIEIPDDMLSARTITKMLLGVSRLLFTVKKSSNIIPSYAYLMSIMRPSIASHEKKDMSTICSHLKSFSGRSQAEETIIQYINHMIPLVEMKSLTNSDVVAIFSGLENLDMDISVVQEYVQTVINILKENKLSSYQLISKQILYIFTGLKCLSRKSNFDKEISEIAVSLLQNNISEADINETLIKAIFSSMTNITGRDEFEREYITVINKILANSIVPNLTLDGTSPYDNAKIKSLIKRPSGDQMKLYQNFSPSTMKTVIYNLRNLDLSHEESRNLIEIVTVIMKSYDKSMRPFIGQLCLTLPRLNGDYEERLNYIDTIADIIHKSCVLPPSLQKESDVTIKASPSDSLTDNTTTSSSPRYSLGISGSKDSDNIKNIRQVTVAMYSGLKSMSGQYKEERKLIGTIAMIVRDNMNGVRLSSSEIGSIIYGLRSLLGKNKENNLLYKVTCDMLQSSIGERLSSATLGDLCFGLQSLTGSSVNERQLLEVVAEIINGTDTILTPSAASEACFGIQNMNGESLGEQRVINALANKLTSSIQSNSSSGSSDETFSSTFAWNSKQIGLAVYGMQNLTGKSTEEKAFISAIHQCIIVTKHNAKTNDIVNEESIVNICNAIKLFDAEIPICREFFTTICDLISMSSLRLTTEEYEIIAEGYDSKRHESHRNLLNLLRKCSSEQHDVNSRRRKEASIGDADDGMGFEDESKDSDDFYEKDLYDDLFKRIDEMGIRKDAK